MWPVMKEYHWLSLVTGELVESFPELMSGLKETVQYYKDGHYSIGFLMQYLFLWRYSRKGF